MRIDPDEARIIRVAEYPCPGHLILQTSLDYYNFKNYYTFYLDFIRLLKPFGFFHSEQLVWSGYISDSNNMSLFLFLVMSSDVQRIILLSCISLFLC